MKHLNSPIPSVTALRPDLPAIYDAFFQRALAKRPDQRFQSAQEFTEAADALLNGEDPTRIPVASGPISVSGASGTGVRGVAALVDIASGQVFPLTAADMVIGRSDPARNNYPDIDLLPLDPSQAVSRRHARFMRRDGHCYIEDLNAFNKTRVNGRPLVPHEDVELQDGDTLRLGNIDLRFEARGR